MAAAAWFLLSLVVLVVVRHSAWPLTGSDPYYHLRFASHVLENGIRTHELPWLRFSIFQDHWGDKEFLFRLFLLPFASMEDSIAGGKLALSVLNALQAACLAFLGTRWFGRKGYLLPAAVLAANAGLLPRLDLLRPHNLSLLFLLVSIYLVERRAYRRLGLASAAYALAYTAAHTLTLLCFGLFLLLALFRKERDWGLLLYPPLGFGLGLLLHPAFPHNVLIWKLTNVSFYIQNSRADLGMEIFPLTTSALLLSSSMGILLFAGALLTTRPWPGAPPVTRREVVLGGVALVFLGMTLLAFRFIEYAAPFAVLYGFALYDRLESNPAHSARNRRVRCLFMGTLLVYAVGTNVLLVNTLDLFEKRTRYFETPDDARRFHDALPAGAKVASRWDTTALYCYAAPQALYLNVVDPIYMLARDPELGRMAEALFDGRALDPVELVRGPFDSEYLAVHKQGKALYHQVVGDPRMEAVYEGPLHVVYRITGDGGFVTNWDVSAEPVASDSSTWEPPSPSTFIRGPAVDQPGRAYVSPDPFSWPGRTSTEISRATWWARRTVPVGEAKTIWVGLISLGPCAVYVDGNPVVQSSGAIRPWRGEARFPLYLAAGDHEILVNVRPGLRANGFFWRESNTPFMPPAVPAPSP